MKTANLINQMKKNGIEVKRTERQCQWGTQINYTARFGNQIGSWVEQVSTGEKEIGEFRNVYIHSINQEDDIQSDYSCGSFAHTIKQAVNWMTH